MILMEGFSPCAFKVWVQKEMKELINAKEQKEVGGCVTYFDKPFGEHDWHCKFCILGHRMSFLRDHLPNPQIPISFFYHV